MSSPSHMVVLVLIMSSDFLLHPRHLSYYVRSLSCYLHLFWIGSHLVGFAVCYYDLLYRLLLQCRFSPPEPLLCHPGLLCPLFSDFCCGERSHWVSLCPGWKAGRQASVHLQLQEDQTTHLPGLQNRAWDGLGFHCCSAAVGEHQPRSCTWDCGSWLSICWVSLLLVPWPEKPDFSEAV